MYCGNWFIVSGKLETVKSGAIFRTTKNLDLTSSRDKTLSKNLIINKEQQKIIYFCKYIMRISSPVIIHCPRRQWKVISILCMS